METLQEDVETDRVDEVYCSSFVHCSPPPHFFAFSSLLFLLTTVHSPQEFLRSVLGDVAEEDYTPAFGSASAGPGGTASRDADGL